MRQPKITLGLLVSMTALFAPVVGSAQSDFVTFKSQPSVSEVLSVLQGNVGQNENIILRQNGQRADTPNTAPTTRKAPRSGPQAPRSVAQSTIPVSPADDGNWVWMTTKVEFALASSEVLSSEMKVVETMGRALQEDTSLNVTISGHADARGSHAFNDRLSMTRAEAVRLHLISRFGIAPERLSLRWRGEREPLPLADPYADENRRVQFGVRKSVRPPIELQNDSENQGSSQNESDSKAVSDLLELLRNPGSVRTDE